MQIYVHRNNEQLGPYTEDEIKAQLAAGTITLQDNVWWQGQPNWMPLGQTSLVTTGVAPAPGTPAAATFVPVATQGTSQLAIWALVCGCLSLFCSLFASIPAIILGHMGLSAIKKNPGMQGKGMALAGMILGYIFTLLIVIYFVAIAFILTSSSGNQFKDIFKTISSQIAAAQAAQAAQAANNTDQTSTSTNSDQTTTPPDQSTPSTTPTNSPDQSTNSAPATPAPSSDSSTNAAPASTNAAPMSQ